MQPIVVLCHLYNEGSLAVLKTYLNSSKAKVIVAKRKAKRIYKPFL
jgi:hypothetical protein